MPNQHRQPTRARGVDRHAALLGDHRDGHPADRPTGPTPATGYLASVPHPPLALAAVGPAQHDSVVPGLPSHNPFSRPLPRPYPLENFSELSRDAVMQAFYAALDHDRDTVREVAESTEIPTFANTVVPLEDSLATLDRVRRSLAFLRALRAEPAHVSLHQLLEPQFQAHLAQRLGDAILGQRLAFVATHEVLEPDEGRLLARLLEQSASDAAGLPIDESKHIAQLHARAAALTAEFSRNLDHATRVGTVRGDNHAPLDISVTASTRDLPHLRHREVRERVFTAHSERSRSANQRIVRELAAVRASLAEAHGEQTYMDLALRHESAANPAEVKALLDAMLPACRAAAVRELDEVRLRAACDGIEHCEPWDLAYYQQVVRHERMGLAAATLREHLELNTFVRQGIVALARENYGLELVRRHDIDTYHPYVSVWEVFDDTAGQPDTGRALLFLDPFARDTKDPTDHFTVLHPSLTSERERPIVVLSGHVAMPEAGAPCLLTLREAEQLFAALGGALHAIFTRSAYLSGRGVDLPGELLAIAGSVHTRLLYQPRVLGRVLRHWRTGEPLPRRDLERVARHGQWGQAIDRLCDLAHGYLDLAWHTLEPGAEAPRTTAVERGLVEELGLLPLAPFISSHLFHEGLASSFAGRYYSRVWADVIAERIVRQHLGRRAGEQHMRTFGTWLRERCLSIANTGDAAADLAALYGAEEGAWRPAPDGVVTPLRRSGPASRAV
ncbi:hypothetical protein JT358_06195 [Micrococcales bacterium 31B]|nr:hypothetical protein [Micrococcales bacterium 31B]